MSSRLFLLGSPRLVVDGAIVRLPPKAFAVLAILVLSGETEVARRRIAGLLWDRADRQSGNLRKLLWTIQQAQTAMSLRFLRVGATSVALVKGQLDIDLSCLTALLESSGDRGLAAICDLYTGDLLEGIDVDTTEWNDWHASQRSRLREAYTAAVTRMIESTSAETDATLIRNAARRLIELDSYSEAGRRALMRSFAAAGEIAKARKVYTSFERRLKSELSTVPAAATTDLFREITAGPAPQVAAPLADPGERVSLPVPRERIDAAPNGEARPLAQVLRTRTSLPKITILAPTGNGADPGLLDLAAALVTEITIGLCRSRLLSVLAPHSAWRLTAHESRDDALIQFGVDYAVETQLSRKDATHQLLVMLFAVDDREIIWVDRYAFEAEDAAQRYDEISARIASFVAGEVERAELRRFEGGKHPTAYYWYLMGRRWMDTLELQRIRRGRRALRVAAELSPTFAPTISALARSYQLEWLLRASGDAAMLAKAHELASRAVQIDAQDARGYRELGVCNLFARRFDASLEAYAWGERLNPQHADLIADYADALVHDFQIPAALAKIHQAIELNPLCPDHYWWTAGGANLLAEDYRAAIDCVSHMQNRTPALRVLAISHAMLGETEEARRCVKAAMRIHPEFTIDKWLEIVPFRHPSAIRVYETGLRKAGFR